MPFFAPHGEYRLELDGAIIKIFATGQTNLEAIKAFGDEMDAMVAGFRGRPFATYTEYSDGVLLTPEAEAAVRASLADRMTRGQVATAFNPSNTKDRLIVRSQIGGLSDALGLPWREFDSYEDARTWLQSQIDAADTLYSE